MGHIMKSLFKCVGAMALSLALVACNTVEGIGKDLSTAGDKIEETANENK